MAKTRQWLVVAGAALLALLVLGCGGSGSGTPPPSNFTLMVTETGTGSGAVTSNPGGINCPTTCSASFASGTTILLSATAGANSTFAGWGGACSGTGTCNVTMNSNQAVTAAFNTTTSNFTLTVNEAGNGTGTVTSSPAGISCPSTCSAAFASGTVVALTEAATNSTFAGWSGACTGTGTCSVTMSSNQAVTATFSVITVSVMPSTANVVTGASQPFMATVMGTTNMTVTWQVNGITGGNSTVGTITAAGVYTAPPTLPASANPPVTVAITATSVADPTKTSPPATVTIVPNNQQPETAPIQLGTTGGNNLDLTPMGNTVTCCSGTLGSLVTRGGTQFILSNNHVLARSDQAKPPEPIGQPGLADAQCQAARTTVVANLTQFAPLKTSNVDAAIAAVVNGEVDSSGAILDLGPLSGTSLTAAPPANTVVPPAINMSVAKSGSRTGLTCSAIVSINTTVQVQYSTACGSGTTFTATFTNQEVINSGTFSAAGDSGSLVVDSGTAQPVGLLYAGSPTNTVANPIQDVLNALKDPATMAVPSIVGGAQHTVSCPSGAAAAAQPQAAQAVAPLSEEKVAAATVVKEKYVQQLMADPAVLGVGVGASEDAWGEAAVVVFVDKNAQHAPIPAQLDGIRTKVILTDRFHALNATTGQTNQPAQAALPIAQAEVTRVTFVKEKYVEQMMTDPAIIGVGVGASMDSPGEAAIIIFVDKSKQPSTAIAAQMDNVRTRIILTEPFRSFGWNEPASKTCGAAPAMRVKK